MARVPSATVDEDAATWGEQERQRLGPPVEEQLAWGTGYEALRAWTRQLESAGVIVVQVDLGRGGLRGFSLWDDYVPIVAINSGLDVSVRAFTIFHEYGHLLTRSDWACDLGASDASPAERWCEAFAASFLIPESALRSATSQMLERVGQVEQVTSLARRFRVSARAMAARLTELNLAAPGLYRLVNSSLGTSDWTRGGGGAGETSAEKRIRQLGARPIEMLMDAYHRGELTRRDLQMHLRLDGHGLDEVESLARHAG